MLFPVLMTASLAAAVCGHNTLKPHTRQIATVAPLVFSVASLSVFGLLAAGRRSPAAAVAKRLLIDLALGSVLIPGIFLDAERLYAPIAMAQGADQEQVLRWIATDDDLSSYRAWSRMVTMSPEEKNDLAVALAPLLTGDDAHARRGAAQALDLPLRKHLIATLAALAPSLRRALAAEGSGAQAAKGSGAQAPAPADVRAADFARGVVGKSATSVFSALEPENRGKLPKGGLEALLLALATDGERGKTRLERLGDIGDDEIRPLAIQALRVASH